MYFYLFKFVRLFFFLFPFHFVAIGLPVFLVNKDFQWRWVQFYGHTPECVFWEIMLFRAPQRSLAAFGARTDLRFDRRVILCSWVEITNMRRQKRQHHKGVCVRACYLGKFKDVTLKWSEERYMYTRVWSGSTPNPWMGHCFGGEEMRCSHSPSFNHCFYCNCFRIILSSACQINVHSDKFIYLPCNSTRHTLKARWNSINYVISSSFRQFFNVSSNEIVYLCRSMYNCSNIDDILRIRKRIFYRNIAH